MCLFFAHKMRARALNRLQVLDSGQDSFPSTLVSVQLAAPIFLLPSQKWYPRNGMLVRALTAQPMYSVLNQLACYYLFLPNQRVISLRTQSASFGPLWAVDTEQQPHLKSDGMLGSGDPSAQVGGESKNEVTQLEETARHLRENQKSGTRAMFFLTVFFLHCRILSTQRVQHLALIKIPMLVQ